jgi:putative transposase
MSSVACLSGQVSTKAACEALGVPRATYYRQTKQANSTPHVERPLPPLALTAGEEQCVLDILHEPRFQDCTPYYTYATLLDEGTYYCSIRTMYRILAKHDEVRERRRQVSRPHYAKPELLATGANQVWSWDITKLKGPVKWSYYQLYVIIDIYSRYVVGWMLTHREAAVLAKRLIKDSFIKQDVPKDQLTIHADRGSSMKSKAVALLLADLGVTKTHNRPHVSNDNPYSESQFKTLKYRPDFPDRFGSIEDARSFCRDFFTWYNCHHKHSGLGLVTPEQVHYGMASEIQEQRAEVLHAAFLQHPNRFKGKVPKSMQVPEEVWINPPKVVHLPEETK